MGLLKRTSYILFVIILLVSCSTANQFNREVKRLDKANGQEYWKANKKFFKYMKDSLMDTKHIYYGISKMYRFENMLISGWGASIYNEKEKKIYFLYYDLKDKTMDVVHILNMDSVYYSRDTVFVKEGVEVYPKDNLSKYFKDSIYVANLPHTPEQTYGQGVYEYQLFKEYSCDTLKILERYNDINADKSRMYELNLNDNRNNKACYYSKLEFLRTLYEETYKW